MNLKRELLFWLVLLTLVALIITAIQMALPPRAHAHDWKRPDLDTWYMNLHRQDGFGCCNKTDCHVTEAEIRKGKWWARVGTPVTVNGHIEWRLGEFVEIPDDKIVRDKNGNAVANPEGDAVFCHSITRTSTNADVDPKAMSIYCFVPGTES